MAKNDGGWLLPDPIDPPNRKSVCICLPDEEHHVMAFWGNLQNLGYWFNWQYDPTKTKALETSILWNQIITEAHQKWLDGVMCTSCEELIECLQPLIDELHAKLDSIQSGVDTLNYGAGNSPAGEPLSPEQLEENIADGNPTCDLDILWAQSLQLVEYTHLLILDALEAAEAATNSLELLEVLTAFPGIDEVGADVIAGYISLLQDGISENYAAEFTETVKETIACAIFCACRADCEITINRVVGVYNVLLLPYFGDLPAVFSTLSEFMSYFLDQSIGSDSIVYVLHDLIWQGGALANIFLGDIGTKSLQTLLLLAVNDANDDWILLCDCPEEWDHTIDFTAEDGDFDAVVSVNTLALYGSGVGWGVNTVQNTNTISIQRALPDGHYTSIEFTASVAPAYVSAVTLRTALFPSGSVIAIESNNPGTAVTELAGSWTDPGVIFVNYSKTESTTFSGYTGVLISVTFRGTGVNPFL